MEETGRQECSDLRESLAFFSLVAALTVSFYLLYHQFFFSFFFFGLIVVPFGFFFETKLKSWKSVMCGLNNLDISGARMRSISKPETGLIQICICVPSSCYVATCNIFF
jgi:hypothetical protein